MGIVSKIKAIMADMPSMKRGQAGGLAFLQSAILTLVVIGILLGVSFQVLNGFQASTDNTTAAYEAIGDVVTGMTIIPEQMGTIVWIILAVVFLGLLAYFGLFGGKR
jgi:uncharacterized membrane protein